MRFTIKLNRIKSVDTIEGYWTKEDYVKLLELYEYPDAGSLEETEALEMLHLAISDFEPDEAAEILLRYKLNEVLKEGQIKNLSHEMLEDKVSEEYPDISLHYPLFNINKLLYDAFNGKFPKTLASVIDIELHFEGNITVNKEVVLRALSDLLSSKSLLKRMFHDQLDSKHELTDAQSIIWELRTSEEDKYQIVSSDYWLNQEDFELEEFNGELTDDEINH